MDHVLGRMLEKSGCGVSFGSVRINDLDFADDAVIFVKTTEILAGALDSMSGEAVPLGLRVSWIKTKVQAFGDIPDTSIESLSVNGENVEVTETFTYLGSVIHSSTSCELKVNRRLGRACTRDKFAGRRCGAADTCAKRRRSESFAP